MSAVPAVLLSLLVLPNNVDQEGAMDEVDDESVEDDEDDDKSNDNNLF